MDSPSQPTSFPTTVVVQAEGTPIESRGVPGLVSVVVLCCGQLEHTRLCLPSILRFSRPPFEVVALDAGSLDGTRDYLAGIQAAAAVPVAVVRSPAEADLPLALQDGLARARGEFLVLVCNDTIVPDSWLNQLTALASANPIIGLVAPMTNYGPGPQLVGPVPYRLARTKDEPPPDAMGPEYYLKRIDAVDQYARQWRDKHRGQWFEAERLGGGCVLLKRAALQAVGPPPGAPLSFFDAEDLSQRVLQAGFRLACCRDLFVHWSGSRTFAPRPATVPRTT